MLARIYLIIIIPFWLVPGVLIACFLNKKLFFNFKVSNEKAFTLALGLLVNLFIALVLLVLPVSVSRVFRFVYMVGGNLTALMIIIRRRSWEHIKINFWLFFLGFVFLVSQIYFTSILVYPSNTDSITHYRYISFFVSSQANGQALYQYPGLLRFYHYGFHLIVLELFNLTGVPITDIMLVVGIYTVVLTPFMVILPLSALGLKKKNYIWTTAIIGFAFLFPTHGVNWGKYPALLSILVLPLPIALLLEMKDRETKKLRVSGALVFLIILFLVGLMHWRALIVLLLTSLVIAFYYWFCKERVPFIVSLLITIASICFLWIDRNWFEIPFAQLPLWIALFTIGAVLMIRKALKKEKNPLAFSALLYLSVRLSGEISLTKFWPQFDALIDKPYFRIVLPVVAALFVGLMVEEIFAFLHGRYTIVDGIVNWGELFVLLAVSLILLATPIQRKIIPSNTYILVDDEQKQAIDWALNHFEQGRKKLLLAGMPQLDYIEYADAGGWLAEKGNFPHVFAIERVDFSNPDVRTKMCREKIEVVFVDRKHDEIFSFDTIPDTTMYKILFQNNDVKLISPLCDVE